MKKREAVIENRRGRGRGIPKGEHGGGGGENEIVKESEDQRILRKLGMQQNKYVRERVSKRTSGESVMLLIEALSSSLNGMPHGCRPAKSREPFILHQHSSIKSSG